MFASNATWSLSPLPSPTEGSAVPVTWRSYVRLTTVLFAMVHLAAIVGAIWFWSWGGVALALGSYFARMVVVTDAYVFGRRRYETSDDSRNSFLLALATTGEGWHNHHHHYPSSARQGFRWWEIDVTYYVLWLLARFAIVWDLRPPPSGG